MKTLNQRAVDFLEKHGCESTLTKDWNNALDDLVLTMKEHELFIRKEQDKITRHACAEAVTYSEKVVCRNEGPFICTADAEDECMNVKAV